MEPSRKWPTVEKARFVGYKAGENDINKNYEEAAKFYERSASYLLLAIKHEAKCDESRWAIRNQYKKYADRTEQLKSYLEREEISSRMKRMGLDK